jgi:ABC-type dipeptide/oligopeptide/nickel transport system permease subunit
MDRQTIRLPDIDPAIAQANATGPVPLTTALKSAGFSIGVLVFFVIMIVGWPQLAKLQRGQQVEASAAAPAPRF